MHMQTADEKISVRTAMVREHGKNDWNTEEYSRRYWRKVNKQNGGRKVKSLRSHREGR